MLDDVEDSKDSTDGTDFHYSPTAFNQSLLFKMPCYSALCAQACSSYQQFSIHLLRTRKFQEM